MGRASGRVKLVSPREFWIFVGIILSSAVHGKGGSKLWEKDNAQAQRGIYSVAHTINLSTHMSESRFNKIKKHFPDCFADKQRKDTDPWYQIIAGVEAFNDNRFRNIAASILKIFDESMSAWKPQKTKTGGLPNISFILRKPEPLGTEFKITCCGETGIILFIEIQRGKDGMKHQTHHSRLGATAACSVRMAEATVHSGQSGERIRCII